MKAYTTNPGQAYVVTASVVPCAVNAVMPGNKKIQVALVDEAGQGSFVAISEKVEVSQDSAIVTPVFREASLGMGLGGGGKIKDIAIAKDAGVEYDPTVAMGYSSIAIGKGAVANEFSVALGASAKSNDGVTIGVCSNASAGNSVFGNYSSNMVNSKNNILIATSVSTNYFYGPQNGGTSLILAANDWQKGGAFLEIIGGTSPQVLAGVVSTKGKVNCVRVTMTQLMDFLKSIGGVIYNS